MKIRDFHWFQRRENKLKKNNDHEIEMRAHWVYLSHIRWSVDGLYRDGTGQISCERHSFLTCRETANIVDQFGIKINGFTPSCKVPGRLLHVHWVPTYKIWGCSLANNLKQMSEWRWIQCGAGEENKMWTAIVICLNARRWMQKTLYSTGEE